jgi:lipopolysaccharide/colanic/teichoic acid biosynthesis glycosyltransferase
MENIAGCPEPHRIRPGLTGVAQICAPHNVPRRFKFKYDQIYERRRSFGLDLNLLSFWTTARGRWEHRGDKVRF